MLSIERCNQVLKAQNLNLNNDEVKQVREFLYLFASLQMEIENNKKQNTEEDDKSSIVLQG